MAFNLKTLLLKWLPAFLFSLLFTTMDRIHREVLEHKRLFLLDNLNPTEILDYLRQDRIFDVEHSDEMLSFKVVRDQSRYLLDKLQSRGPRAYVCFIKALESTKSQYLTDALRKQEEYPL